MDHLQSQYPQDYVQDSILAYKEGIGQFVQKMPELGNKYLEFTAACFQDGAISEKEKHLMALSIAICLQDEYCIMYHGKEALDKGATEQEILETVGVCAAFGGGAALAQGVTLVNDIVVEYGRQGH